MHVLTYLFKDKTMNDNSLNYTKHYMINFSRAIDLISENTPCLPSELITIKQASGRILTDNVISPISVPSFNNSAMDGYAVNFESLKKANKDNPIDLQLIGLTAAGDSTANPLSKIKSKSISAWKIMTGAPIPNGYDSVIPIENTKIIESQNNTQVRCFSSVNQAAHVRRCGEDFVEGQQILTKHQQINANRIMALASLGVAKVSVVKQPSIAVFSTGKELVDEPEIKLRSGQIYNSNMPYILDYLNQLPVKAYNAGTNYDDIDNYKIALQKELDKNTNIIISTGAVSMGDFDFIPQTIIQMGGEIIFHKSKIRPGKPILFATFPNGSFYFGLPGNPISAAIGLRFFVSHCINLLLGLPKESPVKAKLMSDRKKKLGFKNILKAYAKVDKKACMIAEISNGQESFKIQPLIDSNGWVILDEEHQQVSQDTLVDFYPSIPQLGLNFIL